MNDFALFEARFKRPTPKQAISRDDATELAQRIPSALVDYFCEVGVGAYDDGLFRTADPRQVGPLVAPWGIPEAEPSTFLVSAFADFAYFHRGEMTFVSAWAGTSTRWYSSLDGIFNGTLCNPKFLNNVLLRRDFRAAKKRLGALDADECFGFFPAIALGGDGSVASIRKVKLREHLALLSQLV